MKKTISIIVAAVVLMIGAPFFAVNFVGENGMAVCFILFFALDPLFSAFIGIFSGMSINRRWTLPLLNAILFLIGVWLFFDFGEPDFILYSVCYLIIGAIFMLFTWLVKRIIKEKII